MILSIVPVMLWAKQGTLIALRDILKAATPGSMSIVIGAAAMLAVRPLLSHVEPALLRLMAESTALFGAYLLTLLFIMKQKTVYAGLLREIGLWPVGSWRTAVQKV
jgi:hypothetical protein